MYCIAPILRTVTFPGQSVVPPVNSAIFTQVSDTHAASSDAEAFDVGLSIGNCENEHTDASWSAVIVTGY